jgi:hypothetical protein
MKQPSRLITHNQRRHVNDNFINQLRFQQRTTQGRSCLNMAFVNASLAQLIHDGI